MNNKHCVKYEFFHLSLTSTHPHKFHSKMFILHNHFVLSQAPQLIILLKPPDMRAPHKPLQLIVLLKPLNVRALQKPLQLIREAPLRLTACCIWSSPAAPGAPPAVPGAPLRESEGCIYLEAQISEDFLAEFSSRISASTPVYQILEVSPPFFVEN